MSFAARGMRGPIDLGPLSIVFGNAVGGQKGFFRPPNSQAAIGTVQPERDAFGYVGGALPNVGLLSGILASGSSGVAYDLRVYVPAVSLGLPDITGAKLLAFTTFRYQDNTGKDLIFSATEGQFFSVESGAVGMWIFSPTNKTFTYPTTGTLTFSAPTRTPYGPYEVTLAGGAPVWSWASSSYNGSSGSSPSTTTRAGQVGLEFGNGLCAYLSIYNGSLSVAVPTLTMPGGVDGGAGVFKAITFNGERVLSNSGASGVLNIGGKEYRTWSLPIATGIPLSSAVVGFE